MYLLHSGQEPHFAKHARRQKNSSKYLCVRRKGRSICSTLVLRNIVRCHKPKLRQQQIIYKLSTYSILRKDIIGNFVFLKSEARVYWPFLRPNFGFANFIVLCLYNVQVFLIRIFACTLLDCEYK